VFDIKKLLSNKKRNRLAMNAFLPFCVGLKKSEERKQEEEKIRL
jgi:hypothetical protein